QATGDKSDCVLQPVFVCPDPIRGGDNKLVTCGCPLTSMTSHSTSLLSPPRIGSGHTNTGCSTQSDLSPVACWVLDPSKPQMGGFSPSGTILVFERSFCVGWVPSIQMYSAL